MSDSKTPEGFSKTEKFFFLLMVVFAALTWLMLSYVQEYMIVMPKICLEEFEAAQKINQFSWPKFSDFWVSIAASFLVWAAWHVNYAIFRGPIYTIINEKDDMDLKAIKADKATDKLFSVLYFTVIVIYGWVVLRQTEFFPFSLGGHWNNDMKNMGSEFPVITSSYLSSLRFYYLSTLGYHINSLRALAWAYY